MALVFRNMHRRIGVMLADAAALWYTCWGSIAPTLPCASGLNVKTGSVIGISGVEGFQDLLPPVVELTPAFVG